ncbi:MAG: hypothetical protein HY689_02210 [Chloroflexi bacterium]|nr:hypothetical protein [Chloroflexota bacterium]
MSTHANFTFSTMDEQQQRAALRARILRYGRQIGWPCRTAITFTEQCARRPWKRCTSGQLWTVVDELDVILWARLGGRPGPSGFGDGDERQSARELRYAHRD